MAKSVLSTTWFARFDGSKEYLNAKCIELGNQIDVVDLIAGFHIGNNKENPHVHLCITLKEARQKQSVAVRLKKHFGLEEKNRDYSLSVWDGDKTKGAVGYLFHEEGAIIFVKKGITEQELELARSSNEAVQAVVKINKERAANKLIDKAVSHFVKLDYSMDNKISVMKFMLRECKEGNNYFPGKFMLLRYVDEVLLMCGDNYALECMAQHFLE